MVKFKSKINPSAGSGLTLSPSTVSGSGQSNCKVERVKEQKSKIKKIRTSFLFVRRWCRLFGAQECRIQAFASFLLFDI
jgi:hypothetical protein